MHPKYLADFSTLSSDCRNYEGIARWLEASSGVNKKFFEEQGEFHEKVSQAKVQMWIHRGTCK